MTNIIEWMIEKKIAKNVFNAAAIANGLKLAGQDFETQKALCATYREWRWAGEKSSTAFTNTLEGKIAPPRLIVDESTADG